MLTNTEIENALELMGKLMEVHGENSFKAKSYMNAAFQLGKVGKELSTMSLEEIASIPGIGQAIQEKILTLLKTGTMPQLQQLIEKTPPGIIQMLHIKGLGPKKVGTIWKELGIESIGELEYACRENRLMLLKGFGSKTQQSVLEKIEFMKISAGNLHYSLMEHDALAFENELKDIFSGKHVSISGAFRRRDVVLNRLDYVIAESALEVHKKLSPIYTCERVEDHMVLVNHFNLPLYITCCTEHEFVSTLFKTTGHENFLSHFNIDFSKSFNSELEIFEEVAISYIVPEMRNGHKEFEWIKKNETTALADLKDIKGIIHNHSTWSDGLNTIEEMAQYCIKMGMQYLVMSDHSASAFYANGLSVERVLQQQHEIDELNNKLSPFKIFKSIESDILFDGSLDYDDKILRSFDCVIASVHSILNMDIEKATNRLLRAIENPYTTILGHPSGRLLLSRAGYPLHYEKIIDSCAQHQVVIELNANPWRLDLDWEWIYYAMEKGVKISVNPDAHSVEGIHDIHYGMLAARKGGLTKDYLFNALNLDEMNAYLLKRKAHALQSA